jgi:hypothetical protein
LEQQQSTRKELKVLLAGLGTLAAPLACQSGSESDGGTFNSAASHAHIITGLLLPFCFTITRAYGASGSYGANTSFSGGSLLLLWWAGSLVLITELILLGFLQHLLLHLAHDLCHLLK